MYSRTCHAAIISRELGIPSVVGTGSLASTLCQSVLIFEQEMEQLRFNKVKILPCAVPKERTDTCTRALSHSSETLRTSKGFALL